MSNTLSYESEKFINRICGDWGENNSISSDQFDNQHIKRGLRNQDGTGVMAGVTRLGNVRGYTVIDGERFPIEGILTYRGINVADIINGITAEDRFGFEEVVYLLLVGKLPIVHSHSKGINTQGTRKEGALTSALDNTVDAVFSVSHHVVVKKFCLHLT